MNKRARVRTPLVTRIRISGAGITTTIAKTRDISDSGVFVLIDAENLPAVGSVVQGQVLDLPMGEGPLVTMEVVRVEAGGIGLQFI